MWPPPTVVPRFLVHPLLVTIETISYVARAVSLGVRLACNIIAGHSLLSILSGFIYNALTGSPVFFLLGLAPALLFTLIVGLEVAIAVIQAMVFVILTCSYIRDAVFLH
jgi:F-type H+-transporting ATPase subunit a